jgi:hypothetical protein
MNLQEVKFVYGGAMMIVAIGCVVLLILYYVDIGKSARLSTVIGSSRNFSCDDAKKKYASENPESMKAVENPWEHWQQEGEKSGKRWNGSRCDNQPDPPIDAILCSEDSDRCMVPIAVRSSRTRDSVAENRDVFMPGRRMAYIPDESVFIDFDKRYPECSRKFRMSILDTVTIVWLPVVIVLSIIAWMGTWNL